MTDQQRFDALGCAGNHKIKTPNLDALAASGVHFTQAVNLNTGPWPARLPKSERDTVETFAEAFNRAISKETSLSPEKLSIDIYNQRLQQNPPDSHANDTLVNTVWENHT